MSPHTEKMATRRQQIRADHTRIRLILFLSLVIALLLAAVFAEWICPYDPNGQDLSIALQPPSPAHPFGTDRYGRDMLSRVIIGGQTSIFSALILVGIIAVGGTLLGLLCGYFGGALDAVIMRVSDIYLAFPGLVFAMAVAAVLQGGIQNAVIALAAVSWPKYARLARSQTLTVKNLTYIQAAKLSGTSSFGILFRHILPNIAGDGHAGHRHHDDGDRGPFFSGAGSPAPHSGVGQYDEQRQEHAADLSLGGSDPGTWDFCVGGAF